ncbi:hypothetical protein AB0G71_12390 [Streptomyces sp. NPDC020403]|uniref:hypothetical protein n=1 Tax=unclassified Streptomyces TaxID=2593676 RepID=UPI0033F2D598
MVTMTKLMDATALRRLADALDRLTESTAQHGITYCAYGQHHIEIEGMTLAVDSIHEGDTVTYGVNLSTS